VPQAIAVWPKVQVTERSNMDRPQKRPEKNGRRNQERTVKKYFEIKCGERRKHAVVREELRRPEQNRRQQRARHERCHKINQQSDCVFQPG
jgi:hypothetical protein